MPPLRVIVDLRRQFYFIFSCSQARKKIVPVTLVMYTVPVTLVMYTVPVTLVMYTVPVTLVMYTVPVTLVMYTVPVTLVMYTVPVTLVMYTVPVTLVMYTVPVTLVMYTVPVTLVMYTNICMAFIIHGEIRYTFGVITYNFYLFTVLPTKISSNIIYLNTNGVLRLCSK